MLSQTWEVIELERCLAMLKTCCIAVTSTQLCRSGGHVFESIEVMIFENVVLVCQVDLL